MNLFDAARRRSCRRGRPKEDLSPLLTQRALFRLSKQTPTTFQLVVSGPYHQPTRTVNNIHVLTLFLHMTIDTDKASTAFPIHRTAKPVPSTGILEYNAPPRRTRRGPEFWEVPVYRCTHTSHPGCTCHGREVQNQRM